jgi:hypothetical protein
LAACAAASYSGQFFRWLASMAIMIQTALPWRALRQAGEGRRLVQVRLGRVQLALVDAGIDHDGGVLGC